MRIYAINLDRSISRWEALSRQATALELPLVRVSGVDGTQVRPESREGCDTRAFERNSGRALLAGEYGCYRSHLKALNAFIEAGEHDAVIVEDDIELSADILARARAAIDAVPCADLIKLFNHRVVGFRRVATSKLGDEIGRAAHGPQGSSACYVITRTGAERLADRLRIMEYPVDVALERGWASGAQIYTTRRNVAVPSREESTIATRAIYRSVKFPWWKRLGTYTTRLTEALCRIAYAYGGTVNPRK